MYMYMYMAILIFLQVSYNPMTDTPIFSAMYRGHCRLLE